MRSQRDDNVIENLIITNAKLESELDYAMTALKIWANEGHSDLPKEQVIKLMNNFEAVLAESAYIFENRTEKAV
jgi:hypothetical protein